MNENRHNPPARYHRGRDTSIFGFKHKRNNWIIILEIIKQKR